MGVTNKDYASDQFFDQTWAECNNCGCLQLLKLLPLSLIYQYNHHTEVVGQVWKNHHDSFANFIARNKPRKILEIGAAHGYLAKELSRELPNSEYTIVEPDSNMVSPNINIIKGYIEDHYSELKEKDCVIHSHVLEHVYKPVDFINQISIQSSDVIGKISDVPLIKNATGAGLFDHVVVDILRNLNDSYPYFRGLLCEIGFPIATVSFKQPRRQRGVTKNNFYV